MSRQDRLFRFLEAWVFAPARIMWSDWRTRIGVFILLLYVFMGTVGVVLIAPPEHMEAPPYLGVFQSLEFPLGAGGQGRGILAMLVHATPAMLKMVISGAVLSTAAGTVVGTVSGYKRGTVDRVLMTVTDIMMTIPGLPLLIVLSLALEPRNPFVVGAFLSINAWAGLARTIRSEVLSLRNESYTEASRIMGMGTGSIILQDVLPSLMPFILINFMGNAVRVIYDSVGLYFLGVLPFTALNWGVMINIAYKSGALLSWQVAHWIISPMVVISLFTLGLILFAQGMDQVFNPRLRARHMETTPDSAEEYQ